MKRKLQQSKSKSIPLEEISNGPSPSDKSNKESLSSTAQNKTSSVENMLYETIDKEDSIISVENHIYDHQDDSRKFKPKIAVESWRKRKKMNYFYQVKPNLKRKWRISVQKAKENKKSIDCKKENKNFQRIKQFHWGGSVITEKNKTVTMVQTYPADNLFFILKCALEENLNLKQTFLNMDGISDIVDYLISDYNEAKYRWLSLL